MPYFIGIDGGGTKTEAVALPVQGEVLLASYKGSSTNPHAGSPNSATKEIGRILDEIFLQIAVDQDVCAGLSLGLAGVDLDEERQIILDYLTDYQRERGFTFPISLRSEAEIALMAALGVPYGTLAIAGTGSGVFAYTEAGCKYRAGGWGHLLGDEGSGYRIGQLTLQAAMKSYDHVYPFTKLTELIMESYSLSSIRDLKTYIYGEDIKKQHIAAFAEICIQASTLQDPIAIQIMTSQAQELAETTGALLSKHGASLQKHVVTTGSIFTHSKLFNDQYRSKLLAQFPCLQFHKAMHSSAVGAALLARKLFHETDFNQNPNQS
ncbi:N-acetylglucosamine kinase [Paenibacillus sp. SYP-B3998]|uniref:N-acetylglucosamine kinase n=1 Tax=Paenibacillus sp. SYP-B3998 TaxID=2678564 RepID=A0A6G4A0M8_9BACL|nr:BadF/BadG/BcrA/BcrD ATPase family protein [Paenibacillus sp. SYP-B3998]NEW07848.1 N-acetylglucosamine kinase [Paenibacillus sp. SYP-B3998]